MTILYLQILWISAVDWLMLSRLNLLIVLTCRVYILLLFNGDVICALWSYVLHVCLLYVCAYVQATAVPNICLHVSAPNSGLYGLFVFGQIVRPGQIQIRKSYPGSLRHSKQMVCSMDRNHRKHDFFRQWHFVSFLHLNFFINFTINW